MRARNGAQAAVGVLLCLVGFILARVTGYRETTIIAEANGCRMVTDVMDLGNDETQGSVVLLHGLAANKKIMAYLARGFAEQNLRVFVPDLPGHGRTPGPFSFERAETCAESFVRQMIARRAIDPAHTILAGHSMGGAIALRVASRAKVAGTIALSPAPMSAAHGIPVDMLPFPNPPPIPPNTLVMSAAWEPRKVREAAGDLVTKDAVGGEYRVIPRTTHVSVLFDPEVARVSQQWVGQVLQLAPGFALPSRLPLAGAMAGLAGLLLLAGPFLRETIGNRSVQTAAEAAATSRHVGDSPDAIFSLAMPSVLRSCAEVAVGSMVIVVLLRYWSPLRFVRVFEGDYLTGFLLLLGISLLLLHRKSLTALSWRKPAPLLSAAFGAAVFLLLITAWLDLTFGEAWLTPARWLRFPALLIGVLPYHVAEELLLGPATALSRTQRLGLAMVLRCIGWAALVAGLFLLHSGEILPLLIAPSLFLTCLLQRAGMDVVRKDTGSPLAAAVFGAILLAGFCLVIFPIT